MNGEFTLEKMKVNERLASMEAKIDILIESNKTALVILTGNGHPENGIVFRVAQIESKEEGKKQNSTALWTFLSSLGVLVIADFIHRSFFSHPKG